MRAFLFCVLAVVAVSASAWELKLTEEEEITCAAEGGCFVVTKARVEAIILEMVLQSLIEMGEQCPRNGRI